MIVIWAMNELQSVSCHKRKGRTHQGNSGNEVILDGGFVLKYVDVHAEKSNQECQWQENECDPAEPP